MKKVRSWESLCWGRRGGVSGTSFIIDLLSSVFTFLRPLTMPHQGLLLFRMAPLCVLLSMLMVEFSPSCSASERPAVWVARRDPTQHPPLSCMISPCTLLLCCVWAMSHLVRQRSCKLSCKLIYSFGTQFRELPVDSTVPTMEVSTVNKETWTPAS